jgi:hypothetical protein
VAEIDEHVMQRVIVSAYRRSHQPQRRAAAALLETDGRFVIRCITSTGQANAPTRPGNVDAFVGGYTAPYQRTAASSDTG